MKSRYKFLNSVTIFSACWLTSCEPDAKVTDSSAMRETVIHAVGYLEPRDRLRRLAFEGQGVIVELKYKIGDQIKAGEVIARLDDRLERSQLALAEVNLAMTVAKRDRVFSGAHPDAIRAAKESHRLAGLELAHRESERKRYQLLRDKRGVSGVVMDGADFDADASMARLGVVSAELEYLRNQVRPEDRILLDSEVEVARAEVDRARVVLAKKALTAPVDGMIAEIFLHEGESISAISDEPVVLFTPTGPLEVRAEVDESFVGKIRVGAKAAVKVSNSASKLNGKVRQIKSVMGRKSVFSRDASERMDLQICEVRIELEAAPPWPVGFEVEIEIEADEFDLFSTK